MMIHDIQYLTRKLSYVDEHNERIVVSENELLSNFHSAIVVLGEPGAGKTCLLKNLGKQSNSTFTTAISFLRQPDIDCQQDSHIVIDGLDEVPAVQEGDALHNVLKKLLSSGKPPFVISCRLAEWNYETARTDLQDACHCSPFALTLEPLSHDDAEELLTEALGEKKAVHTIEKLRSTRAC